LLCPCLKQDLVSFILCSLGKFKYRPTSYTTTQPIGSPGIDGNVSPAKPASSKTDLQDPADKYSKP